MTSINLSAAEAAKRILGFYDIIPAMDPKAFAAGLVEILSNYPPAVLERAASPSRGIASVVSYPNLAKMRENLDAWRNEYFADQDRIARANRKAIAPPPPDPEADARVSKGLAELVAHLKSGFSPSTQ